MELGCIDEANRFWALVQPILFFQRREENILSLDWIVVHGTNYHPRPIWPGCTLYRSQERKPCCHSSLLWREEHRKKISRKLQNSLWSKTFQEHFKDCWRTFLSLIKTFQGLHNSLWRKNISRPACISLISNLDSFPSEKHNGCTMQQNFLSIWKIVSLLVIACSVLCFEMKHREYFRPFKSRLKIFEKIQISGGVEKDGQAVGVKWEQIATVWGQKIATVGGFSLWTRPGHWPYVFADWQLAPLLENISVKFKRSKIHSNFKHFDFEGAT